MTFIGIDLHTNCFTCCYIKEDGTKVIRNFELTICSYEESYTAGTCKPQRQAYPPMSLKAFCKVGIYCHDVAHYKEYHVVEKIGPGSFTSEKKSETDQEEGKGHHK